MTPKVVPPAIVNQNHVVQQPHGTKNFQKHAQCSYTPLLLTISVQKKLKNIFSVIRWVHLHPLNSASNKSADA